MCLIRKQGSTVPLTRKVTNLARRSRDTRETLACQNALLAREHSRALESTRNSKWVTRTRTLASIYYSQEVIVASRVHTRVLFMDLHIFLFQSLREGVATYPDPDPHRMRLRRPSDPFICLRARLFATTGRH